MDNEPIKSKPKGYIFYGFIVAVSLFFIYMLSSFMQYGGSMLNALASREFGWSATSLGLGMTFFSLFQGFSAPLMAKMINTKRIGFKYTIVIGGFGLAIVSFVMATLVKSIIAYIICFGIIGGVTWAMCGSIPIQAGVNLWFTKRRGSMMGFVMIAGGLGGFFCVNLIRWAMTFTGGSFSGGYILLGIAFVLCAILAWIFLKNRPEDLDDVPDGKYSSVVVKERVTSVYQVKGKISFSRIVKHPSLWILTLASCAFFFGYSMFNTHSVLHMISTGLAADQAAVIYSIMPLVGIGGRVLMMLLGDYIETKFMWAAGLLCYCIGFFCITFVSPDNLVMGYAGVLGVGIGWGVNMVCFGTLVANYFGAENYPNFQAISFPIKQVFNAVSPTLAGIIMDASGSYNAAFYTVCVICLISLLAIVFTKRMKTDEEVGFIDPKAADAFGKSVEEAQKEARETK